MATKARCSFSISVKKRPDSMSRFRISATFAVVPETCTSESLRFSYRASRVVAEEAPTRSACLARWIACSISAFEIGFLFSAARNSSREVMIPQRVTTKTSGESEKIFVAT